MKKNQFLFILLFSLVFTTFSLYSAPKKVPVKFNAYVGSSLITGASTLSLASAYFGTLYDVKFTNFYSVEAASTIDFDFTVKIKKSELGLHVSSGVGISSIIASGSFSFQQAAAHVLNNINSILIVNELSFVSFLSNSARDIGSNALFVSPGFVFNITVSPDNLVHTISFELGGTLKIGFRNLHNRLSNLFSFYINPTFVFNPVLSIGLAFFSHAVLSGKISLGVIYRISGKLGKD